MLTLAAGVQTTNAEPIYTNGEVKSGKAGLKSIIGGVWKANGEVQKTKCGVPYTNADIQNSKCEVHYTNTGLLNSKLVLLKDIHDQLYCLGLL